MKNILHSYIQTSDSSGDFVLKYQIGDPFSGLTDFQINGKGQFKLSSNATQGREQLNLDGNAGAEKVAELARKILDAQLWKAESKEEIRVPGDTVSSISISNGNEESKIDLWLSELKNNPEYVTSQEAILKLVHEVSGGKVLETGR